MPKFVVEREIPNVGNLNPEELQGAAQKSCEALREIGPEINWVHSYVTDKKLYCVYIAPSEVEIEQHAEQAGLPINSIAEVKSIIDPCTSES